jgi:hypothetical protein
MVELATCRGSAREVLVQSDYWRRLRRRIESMSGPPASDLLRSMASMEDLVGDLRTAMGAWHGDWTPWNMARQGDRVVLWDWERFEAGVPVGFDALHYDLQSAVRRGRLKPPEAVAALTARAGSLLGPFGVDRRAVRSVVSTYLLEIGARYLHDHQEEAGARLGNLNAWLVPELATLVRGLSADHRR